MLKDAVQMGARPGPGGRDNNSPSSQSFACWPITGLVGDPQACLLV